MTEAPHLRRAKVELFQDGLAVVRDTRSRGSLFILQSPHKLYALVGQSVDSLLAAHGVLFPSARPFHKSGLHAAFRAPPGRHYLGWRVSRAPVDTGEASRALTDLVRFAGTVAGGVWVAALEHADTYQGLAFSSHVNTGPLHRTGRLHEERAAPEKAVDEDAESIIVRL